MNSKKRCKNYNSCKKYEYSDKVIPSNFGNFCSRECQIEWGLNNREKLIQKTISQREKEERSKRVKRKSKLDKLDSISKLESNLNKNFVNLYIRLRDEKEPCISCQRTDSKCWQAGHFISVGSNKSLRFNELNIHKQCKNCNFYGGVDAGTKYRKNLIKKIGIENVEWLESQNKAEKRTREDLEEIKQHYKNKLKQLKLERENA